jgi:hypothetical protein
MLEGESVARLARLEAILDAACADPDATLPCAKPAAGHDDRVAGTEARVAAIWAEVLGVPVTRLMPTSSSLAATPFDAPTLAGFSATVAAELANNVDAMTDDEVEALLEQLQSVLSVGEKTSEEDERG